jgi:hypothetical protein
LANYAKEKGISVSVISLKGEECKLKVLGKIVEETNGNLTKIDPKNVSKELKNIMKDEIIAINVDIEIRIHKALNFRNEDPEALLE